MDGIWKIYKGLPPLRRTKLSERAKDKEDEIYIKLYEANKWWNYWKFQLDWHKLELVNTISTFKREKTYSISST